MINSFGRIKALLSFLLTVILMFVFSLFVFAYGPTNYQNNRLYYIQNVRSGKYLTVDDSNNNIEQNELGYKQFQRFFIRYIETSEGKDYYALVTDLNQTLRVDVTSAYDANGTNIWVFTYLTAVPDAQEFRFIEDSSNVYKLMPKISSTRVLDVLNGSYSNGANVQLYLKRPIGDSYVNAQQWKLYTVETSIMHQDLVDNSKHLDYDCDSMFTDYVQFARDLWNGYKSGIIRKYIPIIRPKDVSVIGVTNLSGAVASTSYESKEIKIKTSSWVEYSDAEKKNMISHEIGHALGMGHLDDGNGANILYFITNSTTTLKNNNKTSYDLAYSNY